MLIGQNFRITPAGAGKTAWIGAETRPALDHPPQVRGKLLEKIGIEKENGITPAGAGKTARKVHGTSCIKDHPRRCGENQPGLGRKPPCAGSPPQVRGKLLMLCALRLRPGITPAGAGKTRTRPNPNNVRQDHPRRCGENIYQNLLSFRPPGSPPQVRGKLTPAAVDQYGNGITPAGAGKTLLRLSRGRLPGDHPRRCGENCPHVHTMRL